MVVDIIASTSSSTYHYARDNHLLLPLTPNIQRLTSDSTVRINVDHCPSFLIGGETSTHRFKWPASRSLFSTIFCSQYRPYYNADCRDALPPLFNNFELSEAGQLLSSTIDMLGGLSEACQLFENKFWREEITRLISRRPSNEYITRIEGRIRKLLKNYDQQRSLGFNKIARSITGQCFRIARDIRARQRSVTINELISQSKYYSSEELVGDKYDEIRGEIIEAATHLATAGVLLQGVDSKCPVCGVDNWFSVDKLSQINYCSGCGESTYLGADTDWAFRLNYLFAKAIYDGGIIPVILALNELSHQSERSFMYYPPCRTYMVDFGETVEIDIIALVDGELVLGEAKSSNDFDRDQLTRLAEVSKCTSPSRIVLAKFQPGEWNPETIFGDELKAAIDSKIRVDAVIYPEHIWDNPRHFLV